MPRPIKLKDIADQLPYVDDPNVLGKAQSNPVLRLALEMSRPVNWWGTGLKPELLTPIAREGIPVVWIPSPEILKLLVAAQPTKRIALLLAHLEDIVAQSRSLLDECHLASLNGSRQLLRRAMDAFEGGYHEAAMALIVVVVEGLALWASKLRIGILASVDGGTIDAIIRRSDRMSRRFGYELAAQELDSPILNDEFDVRRRALLEPISKFFGPFFADRGDPMPDKLSRHAVVHRPTAEHFSKENALLAIMLATSLLREQQAWYEEADG